MFRTADMSAVTHIRHARCVVSHSRHVCCVTQQACLVWACLRCVTQQTCLLCHTTNMSAVSQSRRRRVCCVTQHRHLLCDPAATSAMRHSRLVCCGMCEKADIAEMGQVQTWITTACTVQIQHYNERRQQQKKSRGQRGRPGPTRRLSDAQLPMVA